MTEPIRTGVARRSDHVPLEQTSQPRYRVPESGPAPRVVVSIGDADAAPLLRPGDRHRHLDTAGEAGAALDAELAAVRTGWRVLAVGTERDAQRVRAAALARGALDAEITVVAVDVPVDAGDAVVEGARLRAVHCAVCHHRFDARAAVGDAVGCPACGRELAVAGHHSRTHAAFLGAPR